MRATGFGCTMCAKARGPDLEFADFWWLTLFHKGAYGSKANDYK